MREKQSYPGYAVFFKERSDKAEEADVARLDRFVQLLEIDSKLGTMNEEQLAGLLSSPFPNLAMINVSSLSLIIINYLMKSPTFINLVTLTRTL